jgi:hypothetical protein
MHHPAGKWLRRENVAGIAVLTISLVAVISTIGCGNQYRPVVSAIGPVGPAGQPTKYAVAVSSPSPTSLGLLTVVDFSGDTVLTTPQILSNPTYFSLNPNGTQGYTINAAGSLNTFFLSNPTALISSQASGQLRSGQHHLAHPGQRPLDHLHSRDRLQQHRRDQCRHRCSL